MQNFSGVAGGGRSSYNNFLPPLKGEGNREAVEGV